MNYKFIYMKIFIYYLKNRKNHNNYYKLFFLKAKKILNFFLFLIEWCKDLSYIVIYSNKFFEMTFEKNKFTFYFL